MTIGQQYLKNLLVESETKQVAEPYTVVIDNTYLKILNALMTNECPFENFTDYIQTLIKTEANRILDYEMEEENNV